MSGTTEFVTPYENLLKSADLSPSRLPATVKIERESLINIIKSLLRGVHVDEEWYRRTYTDVDAAIVAGSYTSAKHHFVEDGYFEGRRAGPVVVDEAWYKTVYSDVAEGMELGEIQSAQSHFEEHGYREGRLPSAY